MARFLAISARSGARNFIPAENSPKPTERQPRKFIVPLDLSLFIGNDVTVIIARSHGSTTPQGV